MTMLSRHSRIVLLASYCNDCSDDNPCDDYLSMCNVFRLNDDVSAAYEWEVNTAPTNPPPVDNSYS